MSIEPERRGEPSLNEPARPGPTWPEPAAESPGSGLLAIFLATSVALLTVVVLSFLTFNYFLPVLLICGGIFFMAGFHYLAWGWWLSGAIREAEEEEQRRLAEQEKSEQLLRSRGSPPNSSQIRPE